MKQRHLRQLRKNRQSLKYFNSNHKGEYFYEKLNQLSHQLSRSNNARTHGSHVYGTGSSTSNPIYRNTATYSVLHRSSSRRMDAKRISKIRRILKSMFSYDIKDDVVAEMVRQAMLPKWRMYHDL